MGERLLRARVMAGLSRKDLAERLSVTRQTVRNYEIGTSEPKVEALAKWSVVCGVSIDWLVFGDPPEPHEATGR